MTDRTSRARRDAIRAEYAAEEAEAIENEQAVVSVRVSALSHTDESMIVTEVPPVRLERTLDGF